MKQNKKIKIFLTIILILFITINVTYGGNNTTNLTTQPKTIGYEDYDTVVALEDGDSNVSFSNNLTGYCIEYREHSAKENDTFYVTNTNETINKKTGESVGNYLKTFFVKFHNNTLTNNLSYNGKDVEQSIFNQHIIWHFTDDFTSPVTKDSESLINRIIYESDNEVLGDEGFYDYGNGTLAYYRFCTLIASYENHQNFFAYDIIFTEKPIIPSDDTINNINETINETDTNINNTLNDEGLIEENKTILLDGNKTNNTYTLNKSKPINLEKYKTGNKITLLLITLLAYTICTNIKKEK